MLNEEHLHGYQNTMVDFIIAVKHSALYVDMGLGKTVATLTAIAKLFDDFQLDKVLIVAPLRVALSVWPQEISKWQHVRHLTYTQLAGHKNVASRTVACVRSTTDIDIINREMIDWLVHHHKSKWPYDMVILDESSSFKSASSNRFKALAKVCHAVGIDRIVELTGTPTSVGLRDLWSQIYLLDFGHRLGHSFGAFEKRYFIRDAYSNKLELRKKSSTIIHDKLKDICLSLSVNDYLDMPEKIVNTIWVDIPENLREKYDELKEEFLLTLETGEVEVPFAAAMTNKLLQFCNGAMYLDDAIRWEAIHDKKLEALDSIIEEAGGAPVLIAYQFRSDKERILKRYPQAVALDKNPETVELWNAKKIPILVAHPASAGHGLNLQMGGNISVWFGLTWSLELYQQFNARLWRQGQEKPVFIPQILVSGTIEEVVRDTLAGRYKTQTELLQALKQT